MVKTNSIVNDVYNNKLNNYTDIVNKLKESGASEYESKMILNFAGYSTDLPPDLKEGISGGGSITELKRKKTESEKLQFEDELNNMITSIYGGVEDTENIEDRETVNDRINLIQRKLIEGVASGYITANKHSNYMNMLTPYMNDVLTKTVKEISPDPWFFGKSEIQKEVNNILKISNLDTSDPKKLKDADRKKYYYIKTRYFNSYIKSMRQQFEDIKKRDVNNKYGNVNNWIDFKKTVDEDIRKKMENKAIRDMLVDYSQNELNIKLTGEETNDEILNYIETVENNNLKTDFKNDIMELQYSREY